MTSRTPVNSYDYYAWNTIVALNATRLYVGILGIQLKKFRSKRTAFAAVKFFHIDAKI